MKRAKAVGVNILGPNCPGIIIPGEGKVGVMSAHACRNARASTVIKLL